jgi:hypothetical protein
MNPDRAALYADRKALLVTRAELDRVRIQLAVQEVRAIVAPSPAPERLDAYRSKAKWVLRVALPVLGVTRLGRWLRIASLGLVAYRVARYWRDIPD